MIACVGGVDGTPARAQTCGSEYVIKAGDTLAQIAARAYGNPAQWTIIFYSNQDRMGTNASLLVPGLSIRLPCVGASIAPAPAAQAAPVAAAAAAPPPPVASPDTGMMISSVVRRIEFLTADGYSPYTGRSLEGGGMLTNIVTASMELVKEEAKGRFDFGLSWVNDWSAHLNPLLLTRAFDVGFPWARPQCEREAELDAAGKFRCQKFFFSDPLYEVVTSVFVRQESRLRALKSEEIGGTVICRPMGFAVSEFDHNGRNWVKDGKITLVRPQTVDECFRLLMAGTADGVAVAELVGRSSMASLGVVEQVRSLDPPLALTSLHYVVSRTHPHSRTMLYYVNTALAKLRDTGDYDRIIEKHLNRYWDSLIPAPNPSLGSQPATVARRPAAPAPAATAPAPPKDAAPTLPSALAAGRPAVPTAAAKSEPAPKTNP
jgi:polar amino acid transport system substrate-binding protein